MKQISKFLSLLFLLTAGMHDPASSQNFRPFSAGNIYRFASPSGFYSIKIDSATAAAADSVFWFNKIVVAVPDTFPGNNCGYPSMQWPVYSYGNENILGTKMLEKGNGEFQFIAETGDTVFLQTHFPLSSTWNFHSNSSLTAMISAKTLETFLGTTDSVITVSISNGEELRISKNYGVLTIHNFNAYWAGAPIKVYAQRRLPAKPSYLEFYDFQVGDRLGLYQGAPLTGTSYWTNYYDGYEVLSRQDFPNGDSVGYSVAWSRRLTGAHPGYVLFDTVLATDTITWRFRRSTSRMLEVGTMDQAGGAVLQREFASSTYNGRETFEYTRYSLDTCNKTLNGNIDGGNGQRYTLGLGQTLEGTYAIYNVERILTCYVKQTDSITPCMVPMVDTPEPQTSALEIQIYPNPFSEAATLQFVNPRRLRHDLTVTNTTGQVVRKLSGITGDRIIFERGELQAGLYFFALKAADGRGATGKLLVQ